MTDAEDLNDQHILFNARELKDGIWLERILSQIRRSMCGMGVDTFKDLPDKVVQGLPNLTGPASHPTWEQYVFKMACLVKDVGTNIRTYLTIGPGRLPHGRPGLVHPYPWCY